MNARSWQAMGGVVLALALVFLAADGQGAAKPKLVADINKLAELVAKMDPTAAKQAAALAKAHEFDVVMKIFELRSKDGIGIGAKAGEVKPDGIESLFTNFEKRVSSAQIEATDDLMKAAYVTAAIALVTEVNAPKKKQGKKDPKDWSKWSKDMYKSSLDLAAAFKEKDTKKVKAAALAVNLSCGNCHAVFRN